MTAPKRRASTVILFDPPAARLRMKGQRLRFQRGDEAIDFRVVAVSYPDEWGRCTLRLEEQDQEADR